MSPSSPPGRPTRAQEIWALLFLVLSWLWVFPQMLYPFRKVFLGLDLAVIFHPLLAWVHTDLMAGRWPLITDLALHGAPFGAMSPLGPFASPIDLLAAFFPEPLATNLLSSLPILLLLIGTFFLGRALHLSLTASLLLAWLWSFNGTDMVHLDHVPITWANAFFPWVCLCLLQRGREGGWSWLLGAATLWGTALLTGHFQAILFQGSFLVFLTILTPGSDRTRRIRDLALCALGALLLSAPRWMHSAECLLFDPAWRPLWSDQDRFYHSWWPVNAVTLFFPWFFGIFRYDHVNDFWWRYHFNETQAALSVTALFFIVVFFRRRHPQRVSLAVTALLAVAMALGEWSPLYRWASTWPVVGLFRDPGRWWFPATWALGLAAAYGWDEWFSSRSAPSPSDRKWFLSLAAIPLGLLAAGNLLLGPLRPLLDQLGAWYIHHFVPSDTLHPLSAGDYLARLSGKFAHLSVSLDPLRAPVALPVLLSLATLGVFLLRDRWPVRVQKFLLLAFVLVDLMAFRMPYGDSVMALPQPSTTPVLLQGNDRVLSLSPLNEGPYNPRLRRSLAFPDTNLLDGIPVLNQHLGRSVPRYEDLDARLGWFSWVYKDRDATGWMKRPSLLRAYGVGRVVSDLPFHPPAPFKTVRDSFPYLLALSGIRPRALWVGKTRLLPWPGPLTLPEDPTYEPLKMCTLDQDERLGLSGGTGAVVVTTWRETSLAARVSSEFSGLTVFQKTFLPGWKATLDGQRVSTLRCDGVLLGVPVPAGEHVLDLKFNPTGLRLGFFLSLLFLGTFLSSFAWGRRHP